MQTQLEGRNVVIYNASGSLGGAVARAMAQAGARLFLTGEHQERMREIADATGGETAIVDPFDEAQVLAHLQSIGRVDVSFNATNSPVKQNANLVELSVDDVVNPMTQMVQTRFLTAKAAASLMMRQRSGVILTLTATPGGIGYPQTAGFALACAAIERLSANLAAELGPYGIRVVNIRSGGSPDSRVFTDAIREQPAIMEGGLRQMEDDTMLKRLPPMADIANTAVFLASDLARSITGVTVDVSCGTTVGLNYRSPRV